MLGLSKKIMSEFFAIRPLRTFNMDLLVLFSKVFGEIQNSSVVKSFDIDFLFTPLPWG